MSRKDVAEYIKIPNLLEKLKAFGGSFVPAWFMRDIVKSLNDDENHRTVWKDNIASLSRGRGNNSNTPSWKTFLGNIEQWSFDADDDEYLTVSFHIDHDIVADSLVYPHVHWSPEDDTTGTVRWVLEYTIASGYGEEAFTTTDTIVLEQAGTGTVLDHLITEVDDDDAFTAPAVDSLVIMKVMREASHANDTYTGEAFGLFVDLHYQANKIGSINRNPPHYQEDYEA